MSDLCALVRVHWGRWIADCPRPGCTNSEHHGADPVTRHVGGLTGSAFRCAHCSLACQAVWPPNVDDINTLLSQRPVPSTRNWLPGETLHDLLVQNLEHGLLTGPLAISNDRLVSGELTGGNRYAIGGA